MQERISEKNLITIWPQNLCSAAVLLSEKKMAEYSRNGITAGYKGEKIVTQIILASQSPRRKELLTQIGMDFVVCPSTVEESVTGMEPAEAVKELSLQKAEDVEKKTESRYPDREILVIGADTIVVYNGSILGKPKDKDDAVRILGMLQGKTHSVFTGVTLIYKGSTKKFSVIFAEETKVVMRPMDEEEILWYVSTGEPMDKAGAYGIQGLGARFIRRIEGDYNNVVGLPVGRIYQELREQGGIL